jgi:hypothetical protein
MKLDRKTGIRLVALVIVTFVYIGIGALFAWYAHLSFWICAPLATLGIFLSGALAGWEDGDFEPSSPSEQASSLGRRPRG